MHVTKRVQSIYYDEEVKRLLPLALKNQPYIQSQVYYHPIHLLIQLTQSFIKSVTSPMVTKVTYPSSSISALTYFLS